jgi:hypothetical protein
LIDRHPREESVMAKGKPDFRIMTNADFPFAKYADEERKKLDVFARKNEAKRTKLNDYVTFSVNIHFPSQRKRYATEQKKRRKGSAKQEKR